MVLFHANLLRWKLFKKLRISVDKSGNIFGVLLLASPLRGSWVAYPQPWPHGGRSVISDWETPRKLNISLIVSLSCCFFALETVRLQEFGLNIEFSIVELCRRH